MTTTSGPPRLRPLFDLVAQLREPLALVAPSGSGRRIVEVAQAHASGRISGELAGVAAADWLSVQPDLQLAQLDVRLTLRTPDQALIFVQYYGRVRLGPDGPGDFVAAPRFETAAADWLWLNSVQAIGRGRLSADGRQIAYGFYELEP
jgi:hypothetical protein